MAQNITIKLGDRPYSLIATSPEQEQLIRKAAEEVNRRIKVSQESCPDTPLFFCSLLQQLYGSAVPAPEKLR